GTEADGAARYERLRERGRVVQPEPVAVRRLRITRHDGRAAAALVHEEDERRRDIEARARLSHERRGELLGTACGGRAREQARNGLDGLAAASPWRLGR